MKFPRIAIPLCAVLALAACEKKETDTPKEGQASAPSTEQAAAAAASPAAQDGGAAAVQLPDPVAKVNGQAISRAEFEKTLNEIFSAMGIQLSALPQDQLAMLYRQFAEDMVTDRLIDQASASTEVSPQEVDEEINKISQQYGSQDRFLQELQASGQSLDQFKERLTKLIRQRKWMQSQLTQVEVPEAEAKEFYDKNKSEFEQPDMVKASHILIRVDENADQATVEAKKQQAADLAERARKGEDFGELAAQFSEDPSAKQNKGDLNFFTKDRMVPEFAEAAFSQANGTISDPVRTQFGWHIIKVTGRQAAQTLPFDQVKDDITNYLKESREQQATEGVVRKLREQAQVEIFLPQPPAPKFDLPAGAAPEMPEDKQEQSATTEPATATPAPESATPAGSPASPAAESGQ